MGWKIKAMLDTMAIILIAIGTPLAALESTRTIGALLVAAGLGIKAASEYLHEQGIVEYKKVK